MKKRVLAVLTAAMMLVMSTGTVLAAEVPDVQDETAGIPEVSEESGADEATGTADEAARGVISEQDLNEVIALIRQAGYQNPRIMWTEGAYPEGTAPSDYSDSWSNAIDDPPFNYYVTYNKDADGTWKTITKYSWMGFPPKLAFSVKGNIYNYGALVIVGYGGLMIDVPLPEDIYGVDTGSTGNTSSAGSHLYPDGATPESLRAAATVSVDGTQVATSPVAMDTIHAMESKIRSDLSENESARILAVFDVSGSGGTLTVSMADIKAGGDYRLYHLPSGGDWEVITPTVADGSVTAKVSSFSPFGLVEVFHHDNTHYHHWADTVVEPTASTWGYTMHTCECGESYVDSYMAPTGSNGSGSAAAAARATSPKTGETDTAKVMVTLFMCAAGALAFCVVSGRRKSA